MKKIYRWGIPLVLTALAGVGFPQSRAGAAPEMPVDERELLLQLDRAFDLATAERGAEAWDSYFAENGSMLSGDASPVTGPQAIRESMATVFANPSFSLRWQPARAEILIPGVLGYTLGHAERRRKNHEGKTELLRLTYVTLWKKQLDGSWKIVLDTGSPEGPPTVLE